VIAYGVSGLKTAVVHGHTGLLLPEESRAKGFAASISSFVNGDSGYRDFALQGRRNFELTGSWDIACTNLVGLVRKVILN
jgi:hypothetical protein